MKQKWSEKQNPVWHDNDKFIHEAVTYRMRGGHANH